MKCLCLSWCARGCGDPAFPRGTEPSLRDAGGAGRGMRGPAHPGVRFRPPAMHPRTGRGRCNAYRSRRARTCWPHASGGHAGTRLAAPRSRRTQSHRGARRCGAVGSLGRVCHHPRQHNHGWKGGETQPGGPGVGRYSRGTLDRLTTHVRRTLPSVTRGAALGMTSRHHHHHHHARHYRIDGAGAAASRHWCREARHNTLS